METSVGVTMRERVATLVGLAVKVAVKAGTVIEEWMRDSQANWAWILQHLSSSSSSSSSSLWQTWYSFELPVHVVQTVLLFFSSLVLSWKMTSSLLG